MASKSVRFGRRKTAKGSVSSEAHVELHDLDPFNTPRQQEFTLALKPGTKPEEIDDISLEKVIRCH